jgi:cell division protein FtsW (lipid II flippase)
VVKLVSTEYIRQIIWAITGIILILAVTLLEPKRLPDYTPIIYILTSSMLIYTRFFGKVVNGARSWLGIGDFGIQPSEFMKIATMLFLAKYLESSRHEGSSIKRFVISFGIVLIPDGSHTCATGFWYSIGVLTFVSGNGVCRRNQPAISCVHFFAWNHRHSSDQLFHFGRI